MVRLAIFEFIPLYGPQGLRGKEVPALAGGPCTGLQSCPPAFLAPIRVTVDAWQRLVSSYEAACASTDGGLRRSPAFPDAPHTLATASLIGINSFHGKRSSVELIVRVIACLAEGLGIRGTARVFEIDPNTDPQEGKSDETP